MREWTYGMLADLVLIVHLTFIAFVVCGGWLALRWRRLPWVHLPTAAWGAGIEFGGWFCPLTPLENWLRRAAGAAGYAGSFVDRYLPGRHPSDSRTAPSCSDAWSWL
jgi:hypothetical protein